MAAYGPRDHAGRHRGGARCWRQGWACARRSRHAGSSCLRRCNTTRGFKRTASAPSLPAAMPASGTCAPAFPHPWRRSHGRCVARPRGPYWPRRSNKAYTSSSRSDFVTSDLSLHLPTLLQYNPPVRGNSATYPHYPMIGRVVALPLADVLPCSARYTVQVRWTMWYQQDVPPHVYRVYTKVYHGSTDYGCFR